MKTISSKDIKVIEVSINTIKKEKIVVFPTDTVYGLLCDISSKKAVNLLFKIKKRNKKKPLPIFVGNISLAKKIAHINKKQERFLKKVWPGQVTVILKAKKKYFEGVSKNNRIGLRIPKYKLLNNLLKKIKIPLSGTSANISKKPSSTNIEKIINQFKSEKKQPDLIVSVNKLKKSEPSTIVDLTKSDIKILREGAIKEKKIKSMYSTC